MGITTAHPRLTDHLITLWVQLIAMSVQECHFELVAWVRVALFLVVAGHADFFAKELAWIAKDDAHDSIYYWTVWTFLGIFLTIHFALATFGLRILGARAIPFIAAASDLNVQVRTMVPLEEQIQARRDSDAIFIKRLEKRLGAGQLSVVLWPARDGEISFGRAEVRNKLLFAVHHLGAPFEGHWPMERSFVPDFSLFAVCGVKASGSAE